MDKDREPIRMAEELNETKRFPSDPERFVAEGVSEVAGETFRWSVGPATDIDRNLLLKNPAKALSQVPIEDLNLRFSSDKLRSPSDETLSLAIPLVQARAQAVEQEFHLAPQEKRNLDKVVKKAVSVIGPKRAAAAILAFTTACSSIVGPDTPPTPVIEPTPTLAPNIQETDVAPFPTRETVERPIANASVLEGEALFGANEDIRGEFEKFESDFLAQHGGDMPESVRLTATGILTEYADGEDMTLHPFFSVESDNPEVPSVMNMLVAVPNDGGFEYKLMSLEREEWQDDQGKVWVTLSITSDPRTGTALTDTLEVFAIPQDQINNPDASVWWSPSGIALETTKSSAVKVLAALTVASQEAETAPTYQLEDGTQTERVTEGQLVELFPGSEVFMSERGDVVIINEETGIRLAGQTMRTEHGTYTLLLQDSNYRTAANLNYRETSENMGGYPSITNHPYKEELVRIMSTLIELKEREVNLGSINLASHKPQSKDFIAIYLNPGYAIPLAETFPDNFVDPNAARQIYSGELGYPILVTENGEYLLIRFTARNHPNYPNPDFFPEGREEESIFDTFAYYFHETYFALLKEAATSQGTAERFFLEGWKSVKESHFSRLFSDPNIDFITETAFSPQRGPYDAETMLTEIERARFGISNIIEVDFNKFK